ncbi:MAG: VIT1/CCC1 transporter family protein [Verrucomicrobia bacterium]|nr:VIT1/CCC1 transporter family protein [Verrucomicrobiota bacterium]MBS0637453.1 VIT1/CCC1 transporter family protein [Verrucomicrobiota bacterium]
MKTIYHREEHFTGGNTVRDIVIGMSDGLTVPFALAAGISGAIAETHIVVTAGFAEIAAGSIAMGLGGYLAAKSDAEHFESEAKREQQEIINKPEAEAQEIYDIFAQYGVSQHESSSVVAALKRNPTAWKDFMMKFELGLEKPEPKRALYSAITIALAYCIGGIIPLFPYIVITDSYSALLISATVTLIALFIFGFAKGFFTGAPRFKSAFQTAFVGAAAATCAYLLAKFIS